MDPVGEGSLSQDKAFSTGPSDCPLQRTACTWGRESLAFPAFHTQGTGLCCQEGAWALRCGSCPLEAHGATLDLQSGLWLGTVGLHVAWGESGEVWPEVPAPLPS